jgi:hypothetical protein
VNEEDSSATVRRGTPLSANRLGPRDAGFVYDKIETGIPMRGPQSKSGSSAAHMLKQVLSQRDE